MRDVMTIEVTTFSGLSSIRRTSGRVLLALLIALAPGLPARAHHGPQEAAPKNPAGASEGLVETSRTGSKLLPLPKEDGVFHFVIYGDRTGGPREGIQVLAQAVRDTNLLDPDLVMTVGDLVQGYNERPEWLEEMEEYRAVISGLNMPWYPVAGNHDVYWRGPGDPPPGEHEGSYEEHFGPLWYAFRHKNAGFLVLYTDEGDPETGRKGYGRGAVNRISDEQLLWIETALKSLAGLDHVFVFLHHPRWLTLSYPDSNWDAVHELLRAAGNVSAVFAGHIHQMRYDGLRDGIEYFTLSTTGGSIRMDAPGSTWVHHMNVVTVREDRFTVASIPVGAVFDPKAMTWQHIFDMTRLDALEITHAAGAIAFDRECGAEGVYRFTMPNPTRQPLDVTASLRVSGRGWIVHPDHRHFTVPPEGQVTEAFEYARLPERADPVMPVLPSLELQFDYRTETMRVSFPEREIPIPLTLTGLAAADLDVPVPERGVAVLDGRTASLRVPSADLDLPDGPITVEGWLKARSFPNRCAYLAKTESSEYGLFVNGGKATFSIHLSGAYASVETDEPVLEPNRWHHLAGLYDGSELRLYVDGRLLKSTPASGPRTRNTHALFIGADPNSAGRPMSFFDGRIDEIRLSTTARYTGPSFTPSRRFTPDPATALLLHLDKPIGPFAPDASPHARHAQALGAVSYEPEATLERRPE